MKNLNSFSLRACIGNYRRLFGLMIMRENHRNEHTLLVNFFCNSFENCVDSSPRNMKRKKGSKSEQESNNNNNDTSRWKYMAFVALFAFPGIMYVLDSAPSISKNFQMSYVYLIVTAVLAVAICWYFSASLKGSYKYIVIILLPFLLFPSFKVYLCSPVVLVNKDIGTRYKLGSTAEEILQDCGESCLKQFSKSLYSLSLVSPRITLKVMPNEIVDLNATTNSAFGGDQAKMSKLFLIFSLRSVKGKVHSLSMLTKVPFRSTKILEALEKKQSMELTGRIVNIGRDMLEMKAGFERQKLFVRPVVFQPYYFEINNDDEL